MIVDLPTTNKAELAGLIKSVASEVSHCLLKWNMLSNYILSLSDADLQSLGFTDSTTRAYIGSFRVALLNLYEAYTNTAKTGTAKPQDFIDLLKNPVTI